MSKEMLKMPVKSIGRICVALLIISLLTQTCLSQTKAYAEDVGASNLADIGSCAPFSVNAVERLYAEGIVSGGDNNLFNPKGRLTRAQAVTLIVKAAGFAPVTSDEPVFKDVGRRQWAYPYVEAAYRYGITAGTSPTDFSPDRYCTREELAAMLYNAAHADFGASGDSSGSAVTEALNGIRDSAQISPWARKPMAFALSNGIISGFDQFVSPGEYASREQAAVIVDNYLVRYAQKSGLPKAGIPSTQIAQITKSVVAVETYDENKKLLASGSGFCIGNGLFLTNYHVIEYGSSYKIVTNDGASIDAAGIAKYDKDKDLAVIKTKQPVDMEALVPETQTSPAQGDYVLAAGNPMGLQNTVSDGVISGFRDSGGISLIQITAPITNGSSGGALFNKDGHVIGVTFAGYHEGNLNFAIPIGCAEDWIRELGAMRFADIQTEDPGKIFGADKSEAVTEINSTVDTMFAALQNEDTGSYKSALTPDNPAYMFASTALASLFETYDLSYNVENIAITSVTANSAEVAADYTVSKIAGPDFKNEEMHGTYQLQYDGAWKISSIDETLVKYLGNDEKEPASTRFLLDFEPTDAVADPDQPVYYITGKDSGRLYAVNYETQEVREMKFNLKPEHLIFANGKLYVTLLKREHGGWDQAGSQNGEAPSGVIGVIDPGQFQLEREIDIDCDPYDFAVDGEGHIFVSSGSEARKTVKVYSEETGEELSYDSTAPIQCEMGYNPVKDILYLFHAPGVSRYDIDTDGTFRANYLVRPQITVSNGFAISPDGKFVFDDEGTVYNYNLNYLTRLNKTFHDITFDAANDRMYAGVDTGLVYVYDYATFRPEASYKVQGQVFKLFYDGRDKKLAAITSANGRYYMETLQLD